MNLREKHQITAEQGQSLDVKTDILQQLQAVAPSVFADGKLDVERLKQLIGESAIAQGERYALSWAGKSETLEVLRQPTTGTLVPAPEESVNFDQTGHVFIEGENLEVLKILQKNYYGRVKMIYIDPPYNTGNDSFIYPDRFEESRADYLRRVNDIDDKDGTLTKAGFYRKNSKENGQFHSNWLNMMYPRLFLARNLLKDDGVIFVSIDDNEVANLRLLMDEVFGEENFVGQLTWLKKRKGSFLSQKLINVTEYVLIYQKLKNIKLFGGEPDKEESQPLIKRTNTVKILNFPANVVFTKLEDGEYLEGTYGEGTSSVKLLNKFIVENGLIISSFSLEAPFTWSQSNLDKQIELGAKIIINTSNLQVRAFKFFEDDASKGLSSFLNSIEIKGTNEDAYEQLRDLMGHEALMNYPKSSNFIKYLISAATNYDKEAIILDFFGGSGTTAQAILELNAEDGGARKFICVQLPILNGDAPNAQAAGFNHIADIAKERIRRVIKKLEAEQNASLGFDKKPDLGMRVFKVASSNFKIWRGDLMENEDELAEQMELFIDSLKYGAKEDNIAWELAIKSLDPMQLDVRMEKIELGGVPVYNFENGRLFIVLHDISQESINAILAAKPRALLVLDSLFGNQADMITNLVLDCERLNIQFQLV